MRHMCAWDRGSWGAISIIKLDPGFLPGAKHLHSRRRTISEAEEILRCCDRPLTVAVEEIIQQRVPTPKVGERGQLRGISDHWCGGRRRRSSIMGRFSQRRCSERFFGKCIKYSGNNQKDGSKSNKLRIERSFRMLSVVAPVPCIEGMSCQEDLALESIYYTTSKGIWRPRHAYHGSSAGSLESP